MGPKPKKPILACEICRRTFNSKSQAEMHYQGKRHKKISEIHARKQSKRNNNATRNSNIERSFTDRNFHQNANNNKLMTESGENIAAASLLPPTQDSSAVPEASGSNNN